MIMHVSPWLATTNTELLIQFSFLLGLFGVSIVQVGENLYGYFESLLNNAESSGNLTAEVSGFLHDTLKATFIGLPGNSFDSLIDPGACRDLFLYNQNHSYT